ncbi:MAG: hypothetical protein ACK4YQ_09930 [Phenylobacterium sp.]|uniref:hypothetical protein n=1 Tax=Phenylobacterium sp. TaxID=1871053 RepID=UPI003919BA5B
MAKPRARKLKVFQAQFGFYDTVIAAPSRAAAMRAWGVRQNLFADGAARETSDAAAVAAASAHPGVVLKRPVGSKAPFELDPSGLPQLPDPPPGAKGPRRTRAKPDKPPPPPDRSDLDAAEAALHALDERRKSEEAKLEEEQAALDARRAAAQDAYVKARTSARAAVAAARAAYRKVGGVG